LQKKRWDENNSKDAILSAAKTVVSLYNPGIEFTILADNTMLEAATRRVHNTFGNRLNYSGNNLPSYKLVFGRTSSNVINRVHEKTKDRLMRLCLQVFTCRKKKESEKLTLERR
jgi:hypothetical protein